MKIAFSPCPNDTFVFHAWAHGLIPGAPELDIMYADIDITNTLATRAEGPEVMKISYAALPWVLDKYALLPCGGALGRGCGPLVLTQGDSGASANDPARLSGKRVAVPSERSTAYLLFGKIDAGLVIHEARFTYQNCGLSLMTDLGNWWEADTNLPIPLGAIIARRSMDLESLANWTRASVEYAWANPTASEEYVMCHAQELSVEVAKAHIDLYVNEFTRDLGEDGYAAITALLGRAAEEGLVPRFDLSLLRG